MGYSEDFIPDGMNAFERNVKRIGDCMDQRKNLRDFHFMHII